MALGISDYQAPPWIINMQRYGAPPSYPTLRILGSNIPFSQVASYSIINKQGLEEVSRKLGQPGLYATFRTYYEEEQ
jgi:splicing factor 3B subunit 2